MADEELITPRLEKGKSPLVKARGTEGFFNFNVPPQTGGTPFPRHLFITKEGNAYYQQLEKSAQGGRWEEAHHARSDFERYSKMPDKERFEQLNYMWQGTPVAKAIDAVIKSGGNFEDMKRLLENYDTWRQISHGEPKVNKSPERLSNEELRRFK